MIRARQILLARLASIEGKLPPKPHDLTLLDRSQLRRYREWRERVDRFLETHPDPGALYEAELNGEDDDLRMPIDLQVFLEPETFLDNSYKVNINDTDQDAAEKYRVALEKMK